MFSNLSLNARLWIAALALAVGVGGIGLVVALVSNSGSGGGEALTLASPAPEETEPPVEEPATAEPEVTSEPSATPEASATPSPAPPPAAGPERDPRTINCAKEPRFCSDVIGKMTTTNGRLTSSGDVDADTDYRGVPQTTMDTTILKTDAKTEAHNGDEVGALKIHVDIVNKTNRTFVFPHRLVAVQFKKNGKAEEPNETPRGPSTEIPPGGRLSADFFEPIPDPGTSKFEWRATTWFYAA
jgi:hypothetical protein